jgi:8-oxo-dGTP pyrophosphatase MutT (NUDIX family)
MQRFWYFMIEGFDRPFGYIHESNFQNISWPSPHWSINKQQRLLTLTTPDDNDGRSLLDRRTAAIMDTLQRVLQEGKLKRFRRWTNELVPVYSPTGEHVVSITANSAHIFGTVSFGVSLIAWTTTANGRLYWLQKRSMNRAHHPGKLDTTASGALRSGERVIDGMVREAEEEANIDKTYLYENLRSCGTITYHLSWNSDGSPASLPHVLYAYEMELAPGMTPGPSNGEVESFVQMDLDDVRVALFGDEFKPIVGVHWVGHFYRHGIMNPENEAHIGEICSRIHRRHQMFIV